MLAGRASCRIDRAFARLPRAPSPSPLCSFVERDSDAAEFQKNVALLRILNCLNDVRAAAIGLDAHTWQNSCLPADRHDDIDLRGILAGANDIRCADRV